MFCCVPSDLVSHPSPYIAKLIKVLRFLTIFNAIFAVYSFFYDAFSALVMMICSLLLFCVVRTHNWCLALFFILIGVLQVFDGILYIGNEFSVYLDEEVPNKVNVMKGLVMLKVPLFIVTIFYTFLLYRELKAMFIENARNAGLEMPDDGFRGFGQGRNLND